MSRRTKLTRADRAKRAGKRERRIETAPERVRRRSRVERLDRYQLALRDYLDATDYPVESEIVCERCGLAQPATHFEGGDPAIVEVVPCEGPLGMGCGHEYAVTVEAFTESI